MPGHGLSVHLLLPSLISFFHENQNIFKKVPPQLQGRSEFQVLTSLLQDIFLLDLSFEESKQVLELLLLFYEGVLLWFLCWERIWSLKPDQKEVTQHSWTVLSSALPKAVPHWPARIWFFVSKSSGLQGEAA